MSNIVDAVEALKNLERRIETAEQTVNEFVGLPDRVKALEETKGAAVPQDILDRLSALEAKQGGDIGLIERVKALEDKLPELEQLEDAIANLKESAPVAPVTGSSSAPVEPAPIETPTTLAPGIDASPSTSAAPNP